MTPASARAFRDLQPIHSLAQMILSVHRRLQGLPLARRDEATPREWAEVSHAACVAIGALHPSTHQRALRHAGLLLRHLLLERRDRRDASALADLDLAQDWARRIVQTYLVSVADGPDAQEWTRIHVDRWPGPRPGAIDAEVQR